MKIPKHFVDAIGAEPANCVLIVGAGLSKVGVRKEGRGLPDWDELMQAMISHLHDTGRCDEAKIEQLRTLLREDPPRYLDVAEEFALAHRDDSDGYETFLRGLMMPDDLVESEIHKLILAIGFRGIVSFNFDRVFEKQSDKLVPIVYPELTDQVGHFQRRGFFAKIHGCITKPARQLVLTRSSYDQLSGQAEYGDLLKAVLLSHKVLCVGFSLRDPDFLGILVDLKEVWRENLSPLYSLMHDPGQAARAEWLKRGVAILPYEDHGDVKGFFSELAELARNGDGSSPMSKPIVVGGSHDDAIDAIAVFSEWQKAQKIEEMDHILDRELAKLGSNSEKERLLFQLAALSRSEQALHLCRQLVSIGTPACAELSRKVISDAARDEHLSVLKPHPLHVPIHRWFINQGDWRIPGGTYDKSLSEPLKWLFEPAWGSVGVDLWDTFLRILNRLRNDVIRRGFEELYAAAAHIPGAVAEIEKVVFAAAFVREDDPSQRWYKSSDEHVVSAIRIRKVESALEESLVDKSNSPAGLLYEAAKLDATLPGNRHLHCTRIVVRRLIDNFVSTSYLTIHGHSSLYDPAKSREILDALASLTRLQPSTLSEISEWPEGHQKFLGQFDHVKDLCKGLFVPLWWRYSCETRLDFFGSKRRFFDQNHQFHLAGQNFLLEVMMGFKFDEDEEFRNAFNLSLERYRDPKGDDAYEPRPFEELWRDREFRYEMSDDCPPEIIRRVAIYRTDWERMRDGSVAWAEAKERAEQIWQHRELRREYVSAERGDYAIDNLLGAYFPAERRVVLYRKMVEYTAAELGVDQDALLTVVYIHETVHAFSHLGRDLNGNMWADYAIPIGDSPDERPVEAHEAIAQFYTFKLLQWLNDKRLMDAFLALEQKCDPVYRAWRRTEDYSLEAMRRLLLKLRGSTEKWPPTL